MKSLATGEKDLVILGLIREQQQLKRDNVHEA